MSDEADPSGKRENMQYIISFLEGMITFLSPCILPMLPVYLSYFANGENDQRKTLRNAFGFVAGFALVFVAMGAFAGAVGSLLGAHKRAVDAVTGAVVILLGLHFTGWIRLPFLEGKRAQYEAKSTGFFASVLFGIVFAVGWTPCVGVFLGSALMMASNTGTMKAGILMLLCYSAGLGVPFVLSAVILDKLKETFAVIKRHYRLINIGSGIFLILVGILMMSGMFGYLLAFFSV